MTEVWYFYKWAERVEVLSTTRTFWKYTLSKNDSHITSFGRLLLKLIWCEYKPIPNVLVFQEHPNNSMSSHTQTIYQCIPGIIPNFVWRYNNDKKTSDNS